jgi:hypothetical protein
MAETDRSHISTKLQNDSVRQQQCRECVGECTVKPAPRSEKTGSVHKRNSIGEMQ